MRKKTLYVIIIFLLVVIIAAAYVITSFALGGVWNPLNWGKKESKPEKELVAVTTDGEVMYSGCSYAMPKGLTLLADPAPSKPTTFVPRGEITLTAALSNEYINGKFDWTIEYAGSPSNVSASEIVSVTPISDGAATAKVKFLNSTYLYSQLLVKATLRSSSEIFDTCTVDFLKTDYRLLSYENYSFCSTDFYEDCGFEVNVDRSALSGTVEGELYCTRLYFEVDSDFQAAVKNYLKFDIAFTGYSLPNFRQFIEPYGEEDDEAMQMYSMTAGVEMEYHYFIEDFDGYDQAHKEAIYFAWSRAYLDGLKANGNNYDNLLGSCSVVISYGGLDIDCKGLERVDIPFYLSGSAEGDSVKPSVTLNNNVVF